MYTYRCFVGLALLVVAGPTLGQEVTLKWQFKPGLTFYQQMDTTTNQTMKVMGSDIKQNQNQTFTFSWTVDKQDGDTWILKQKIEAVKMRIEIGGQPIEYDSTKEGQASSTLGDFFKALVGGEFRLTLDKELRVTKIEGRDEFLKKLNQANPQMEPLLKQIMSDEALKEMANPTFGCTPPKAVKPKDTWDGKLTKLDLGPIGRYENSFKYTYEGKDPTNSKLDRIGVETTLKYQPPAPGPTQGGLPFKIINATLASKKAGGFILFDNAKGRVEESTMNVDLGGDLDIEIGGQTTKVRLDQTQTTKVSTTDNNPIAKKPG